MRHVRNRIHPVAFFVAVLSLFAMAFASGASPASANAPDTWTVDRSNIDANNYQVVCEVKWHQHSSGTDNWTPVAFAVAADGPTIFQTTFAHYADPSYTRYGVWGPYDSSTGYKDYSSYIVSDNRYDGHSSSMVIFHFATGSGDYPCSTRAPGTH